MTPPPLRVGATVDGSRMTITFSQRACAQKYNDYLKTLGGRFNETQQCESSASQSAVVMNVPPEVTIASPSLDDDPNSVTLIFENEAEAIAWEQEMILWKRDCQEDDATAETQLSLVTVWKVDIFQRKLGRFSKHDSDDEERVVFGVSRPHTQMPLSRPRFSKPSRPVSETVDMGLTSYLYRFFKGVLGTRFGTKTINEDSS